MREVFHNAPYGLENHVLYFVDSCHSQSQNTAYHTSTDVLKPSMGSSMHNSSVNILISSLISLVDNKFENVNNNAKHIPSNNHNKRSIDSIKYYA